MECSNIKKYFGDRLVLDVGNLKIYSKDRIGVIGVNGVGKTTLINILSKRLEPDEGYVKLYERYSYIYQLEEPENRNISNEMASKFGVQNTWDENMSGGEKTRFKLADGFSNNSLLIFADEPTAELDTHMGLQVVRLFQKLVKDEGLTVVMTTHDPSMVEIADRVFTLEDGEVVNEQ